jgi:nucleoside-diphosphate-sugar epimerase
VKIFLAGATGVLGHALLPLLLNEGHIVSTVTRRPNKLAELRSLGVEGRIGDAFDGPLMTRVLAEFRPDVVMHQMTDLRSGDPRANAALRSGGTRSLVTAALRSGVTRIVAQSIAWAYEPGPEPAGESTPLDLTSTGARAITVQGVRALETEVAAIDHCVLLRFGTFYGPGTWIARNGARATDAHAGALIPGPDVTSFVHVDDAARASVQSLDWPDGPVNVCDDEPAAASQWVPAFCAAVGAPIPVVDRAALRAPYARGADNSYARQTLGWRPRWSTWRDGFASDL